MNRSLPPQGEALEPPEPRLFARLEPLSRTLVAGGRQLGGRFGRLAALVQGLPGGVSLWVGLASAGFLLAAIGP